MCVCIITLKKINLKLNEKSARSKLYDTLGASLEYLLFLREVESVCGEVVEELHSHTIKSFFWKKV